MTGARRPAGGGRDLVLAVHLAFVALLAFATVVLFRVPVGNADCCAPVAAFGLFTLGELVIVLVAFGIAGTTGRYSPLAFVDVAITAPLAFLVPEMLGTTDPSLAAIPLVAAALLIVGLAGAILAARLVREHRIERVVLGGALVLVAVFSLAASSTVIVPLAVLAVLLWPNLEGLGAKVGAPPAPPPRASARVMGRQGPPDAAAILAMRRPGPPTPSEAAPPSDDGPP
jgi:hypothetical protein